MLGQLPPLLPFRPLSTGRIRIACRALTPPPGTAPVAVPLANARPTSLRALAGASAPQRLRRRSSGAGVQLPMALAWNVQARRRAVAHSCQAQPSMPAVGYEPTKHSARSASEQRAPPQTYLPEVVAIAARVAGPKPPSKRLRWAVPARPLCLGRCPANSCCTVCHVRQALSGAWAATILPTERLSSNAFTCAAGPASPPMAGAARPHVSSCPTPNESCPVRHRHAAGRSHGGCRDSRVGHASAAAAAAAALAPAVHRSKGQAPVPWSQKLAAPAR